MVLGVRLWLKEHLSNFKVMLVFIKGSLLSLYQGGSRSLESQIALLSDVIRSSSTFTETRAEKSGQEKINKLKGKNK